MVLSHPCCRHIDNICKQFSVEEKGFWQTRFTKKMDALFDDEQGSGVLRYSLQHY